MEINLSDNINISLQQIMTGRSCVIGQSGSGKSFLMGVIAEELCKVHMPFIIIDTEGEYFNIKTQFNAILVSENKQADISINAPYQKLLELAITSHVPIIFDISESADGQSAVYKLLTTLYSLEEHLREPCLVLIEEADKFAPQLIKKTLNPIEEISVRGRKRGIGIIIATQRPANVSKTVLSQCSYGFIGKLTLDNDMTAISMLFNDKNQMRSIPKLSSGEFITFGLGQHQIFKVKQRVLKPMGSTPQIKENPGETDIKSIIGQLNRSVSAKSNNNSKSSKNLEMGQQMLLLKPKYNKDYAIEYAMKKTMFLGINLSGMKVEKIENLYLPIAQFTVFLPTKRRAEFEKYYLSIDNKNRIVNVEKLQLSNYQKIEKLSAIEREVLKSVALNKNTTVQKLYSDLYQVKKIQITKSVSKLITKKIIMDNDGKLMYLENKKLLSKIPAQIYTEETEGTILGTINPIQLLENAKQLFPTAKIKLDTVFYALLYKITLRNNKRIRLFIVDSYSFKDFTEKIEIEDID